MQIIIRFMKLSYAIINRPIIGIGCICLFIFCTVSCMSPSHRIGNTPPQFFIDGIDYVVVSDKDCFLYGEIRGGGYTVYDGINLLDLLDKAGGMLPYSDASLVSIFRNGNRIITVDVEKIRNGKITAPIIKPKDIIFVPVLGFNRKRFDSQLEQCNSHGNSLQIFFSESFSGTDASESIWGRGYWGASKARAPGATLTNDISRLPSTASTTTNRPPAQGGIRDRAAPGSTLDK
jgi:hypothetical protein